MAESATKPTLIYFDGPGRAELARLALHAGAVSFEDRRLSYDEFGKLKFDTTKPGPGQKYGSVPVLCHGSLQIAQSKAVALYASEIGLTPKLTVKQRAIDMEILGVHADVQSLMYKCLFGNDASKAVGLKELPSKAKIFLDALERDLPAKGFVHGAESPSLADLCVFDMVTSKFPGLKALSVDISKYEKILALVEKVRAVPNLKAYLSSRGF